MSMVVFRRHCWFCGENHEFIVEKAKFLRWQMGELIQNVWPEATPARREVMISGTCPECWDKYVKVD